MVDYELKGNSVTLFLHGRVDSTNAPQLEKEIQTALQAKEHESVHLDLDDLEYISSAGLRVILHLRKTEQNLDLINANAEVYEILEMTGFTEMMPVKKAYRKVSIEGCKCIGTGATGQVYRLDDDIIVKVYYDANALADIQRERALARRAFILGIPTAIPFDVVRVGDKYGSVFELLKAKSFGELIVENPDDVDKYIDLSVELMKKLHSTTVEGEDLPSIHGKGLAVADFLQDKIPAEKAAKFRRMAEEIPDTRRMLHGDLHIKNMMMQNGEVLLIDMDTLCYGHPVYELEALYQAYLGYSEIDHNNTMEFFGIPYETGAYLWKETLCRYLGTRETATVEAVEKKAKLMAYASLYRWFAAEDPNPTGEEKRRQEVYLQHVCTLLDEVDSFVF